MWSLYGKGVATPPFAMVEIVTLSIEVGSMIWTEPLDGFGNDELELLELFSTMVACSLFSIRNCNLSNRLR